MIDTAVSSDESGAKQQDVLAASVASAAKVSTHYKNNTNNEEEDFPALLEECLGSDKMQGNIVKGSVLMLQKDVVLVDVGLKSEGVIPVKEFMVNGELEDELEPGTQVDVYIERIEGRGGRISLSREKARRESAWGQFLECHSQGVEVEGRIIGRVKGGFAVDLGSIIAFLPGSQIDFRPIRDMSPFLNVLQPFKILKMDEVQGNIVVSRKAIIEKSQVKERDEMLATIKEGSVLKGTVKNITDYGAFISLSPIVDGLLHITDIAWHKINHPSEVLNLGQEIEVMVIKYNEETKRVSLGLKQLESNPWLGLSQRYPVGQQFDGVVTSIVDYGAFVCLDNQGGNKGHKMEGLVYQTEISWGSKNVNPRTMINIGDKVRVLVLEVDEEKHRMSLSIKQCKENPWQSFIENNPVGTVVTGRIRNVVSFGMFVTLQYKDHEPIDALIPLREVSWDANPESELKKYKVGDEVTGTIISSDLTKGKVVVGLRQMTKGKPSDTSSTGSVRKGDVVTCTVTDVRRDGIEVEATGGITSFIKKGDISKHKSEQRPQRFAVGDRVDAKVVADSASGIVLSIRELEIMEERKAIAAYGTVGSGASLGDILGDVIDSSALMGGEQKDSKKK